MVKMGHKKTKKKQNLKISIKKVKMELMGGGTRVGWGEGTKICFGLKEGRHVSDVAPLDTPLGMGGSRGVRGARLKTPEPPRNLMVAT